MNTMKFYLLLGCFIVLTSCKLADIRPNDLKNKEAASYELGKKLLEDSYKTMGYDKLKKYETYSIELEEQYYGIGKLINKFGVNPVQLNIDYIPGNFIGKATVKNGRKKGYQYFHNNGVTAYKTLKGKEKKNHKIARKWVPTHQYFLEFPLRIQEATAIAYAGDTIINKKRYHLILASWNTITPQKDLDQYLIGINKETNFIDFIQFTVRDYTKFIVGTAKYNAYKEKEGIFYPSDISLHRKKYNSNKIYQMRIKNLTYNKVKSTTITSFN